MTRPGLKASASYCQVPGAAAQFTRTRQPGSVAPESVLNSYCQKLPPNTAASPGSTAPTPIMPSWQSPPPTITGVPTASPVSAAPFSFTSPATSPHSRTGPKMSVRRPQRSAMDGSQSRFLRSMMPVVEPLEGSTASTPVSL